jgi:hypothetical protein
MIAAWSASSLEKIYHDTPAPKGVEPTAVVRLSAAKGEAEGAQLVLRAEHEALDIEAVETAPLHMEGADIDIKVRLVDYIEVTEASHGDGQAGPQPDPLLPFRPFRLEGTKSLWVDARVPRDARAGLYSGSVTLKAGDRKIHAKVQLRVYDFALPFPPKLVTAFGLYEKPMREMYGNRYDEMLQRYRENLWAHRITHLAFPATDIPVPDITVKDDGEVDLDYTKFDQAVNENIRRGMNALEVPLPAVYVKKERKLDSEYDMETLEKIMADIQGHLEEKGWVDMAYFFLVDEPGRDDITPFKNLQEMTKRAAPRIKRRLDMGYGAYGAKPGQSIEKAEYRKLAGLVEIWVPHIDCVDQEFLEEEQKKGNEVWWYICCSSKHPYPNCLIDYPVLDSRVPFWMMFDAGVTGYAYWTVNWWNEDPFANPLSYDKANGDGMFIYPGKDGPIDSIRWEATRDGFEDYEYLAILASRIKAAEAAGATGKALSEAKEALALVKRVATSRIEYEQDPSVLLEAREKVAVAIQALGKKEQKDKQE